MFRKSGTVALRSIRKTSNISGKVARKTLSYLDRIENKTTKSIVNRSGAPDGADFVKIADLMQSHFPQLEPIHPALPNINQRPSVTVLAFLDPNGFYGGISTLLIVAGELANKLGYDFRIAQTTGYSKKNNVLSHLESKGIKIDESRFSTIDLTKRGPNQFAYLPLHNEDIVIVSSWWDSLIASKLPLKKRFIYLIQDYEPIFYNNGDSMIFANSSYYTQKFIPLCNTKLIFDYFKTNGYEYIGNNGLWFEPAPGPKRIPSSEVSEEIKSKRTLFLYGRPEVHRNLFYSALLSIEHAFSHGLNSEEWQIFSAGQKNIPNILLNSGVVVKNLGKMGLEEYYKFAENVDIALTPMLAPHPNYPTLELASLGSIVVTTKYKNKQSLSNYSKNILMAEPTIENISKKIIEASKIKDSERIENLKSNKIGSDWKLNLNDSLNSIIKILNEK